MIKNPSFNGFSVLDLQQPNDMSYHTEKFEGREYNVYDIRKVQLYPLLAGNLELGVVEMENMVKFIKADYINRHPDILSDMFRDFAGGAIPAAGMENHKVTLQSNPLTVSVKPLPDLNKPAGFKGAVGNFKIDSRVEKNKFSTDDAGRMAIIISGEGNMQLINAPVVNWPAGIEGFDPKATDDLYKGTVPVSGRKIFEFPFTVSKAGTYSLPVVDFSFFDTRDAKYKTIATQPLDLTVTKGTGKPPKINTDSNDGSNKNFLAKFFSNRLRVVSVVAVLIIMGLIIWLKRDTKKEKQLALDNPVGLEISTADEPVEEILLAQQNPLALAEECLQREDVKQFYTRWPRSRRSWSSTSVTASSRVRSSRGSKPRCAT
jgi:hypothetical protein